MPNVFIKGKRVFVKHRPQRRKETFKTEDTLSRKGAKHRKVCPNCGHGDFAVVKSKFSWLFGQKNKCKKCDYIFKEAWTEMEFQREGRFSRKRN